MMTLDKIKIITSADNIKDMDFDLFSPVLDGGKVAGWKFKQEKPYMIGIHLNDINRELVIEFTAKILRDNYPQLINSDNIRECLININRMGMVVLNVDAILADGYVAKADVTRDAKCENHSDVLANLKGNVSNHKKYVARTLSNGNFIVEKNVTTSQLKKRMTIYDKHKELLRSENREFMSNLADPDELLRYFENRLRFELNLTTMRQIRESLNISDTKITTVLNATTDPIRNFVDEVFVDGVNYDFKSSKKEYHHGLVLEDNDYDLTKVEAVMRPLCPKRSVSEFMAPYRALWEKLQGVSSAPFKQKLLGMLA